MDFNKNMQLVLAKEEDLDEILEMIKRVYLKMQSRGLTNWGPDYPTRQYFEEDVKRKELFLLKNDGKTIGTVVLSLNKLTSPLIPEHSEVDWLEKRQDKYLTLFRLAVDPAYQHKGFAQRLLKFADEYCVDQNYNAIRLEALNTTLNLKLLALYEKHGYDLRKFVYFPSRDNTYFMFERVLIPQSKL